MTVGSGTPEVDLTQPRDLGGLLSTAFALYRRHASVFFTMTLVVVAPVILLVDGLWGRQLADGADADVRVGPAAGSGLLTGLLIPAFVTALHVRVVMGLARGEQPTVGRAFSGIAPHVAAAAAAILLYGLVVILGLIALIVPGVWLSVRLYFAAQYAVVEGTSPAESLRRSFALTQDSWARIFGLLVFVTILTGAAMAIVEEIAGTIGDGVVYVVARILVESAGLSFNALFGTLLFFDLRTRRSRGADVVPPAPRPIGDAPERPFDDFPERP